MVKFKLEQKARQMLSDFRFSHSINVKNQAVLLGQKYNADLEKCEIAGLLHDITKEIDNKTQLEMIINSDVLVSDIVLKTPKIYHSVTGMIFAKDELMIKDEDILNAIRYHTTARANMSKLEKIVYIADATSIDRKYDGVEKFRELSFVDLDLCMFHLLKYTLGYLVEGNCLLPMDTILAYNQYTMEFKKTRR